MADSRYGGQYTPKRGPLAGQTFKSYYQYRIAAGQKPHPERAGGLTGRQRLVRLLQEQHGGKLSDIRKSAEYKELYKALTTQQTRSREENAKLFERLGMNKEWFVVYHRNR